MIIKITIIINKLHVVTGTVRRYQASRFWIFQKEKFQIILVMLHFCFNDFVFINNFNNHDDFDFFFDK